MAGEWDAFPVVSDAPKPVSAFAPRFDLSGLSEDARGVYSRLSQSFPNLRFTSGYRDPARNAAVRGAGGSQHLHGNALDISLKGLPPDQRAALIDAALNDPAIRGFGHYGESIHVDTRPGGKAFWGPDYSSGSFGQAAPDLLPRVQQWASGRSTDATAFAGGSGGGGNPLSAVPPPAARPSAVANWDAFPVVEQPSPQGSPPVASDNDPALDPRTMGMAPRSAREGGVEKGVYLADALRERMAQNNAGVLGKVDAAVRGAAQWLPGMNKLAAAGDAAFGQGEGASFGERYDDNLARQRARDEADALLNPNSRLAGQVAGLVPIAAVTPMVNVARGAGMGAATVNSALTGAAYGGASGAIEADKDKLQSGAIGAALGAGIGAVAPTVARGVAGAVSGLGEMAGAATAPIRGYVTPERYANARVRQALQRDGVAGDATQRLAAMQEGGAPVVLADIGGESTRRLARASANMSDEAGQLATPMVNERFAAQAERITDVINKQGRSNAYQTLEQIQQAARVANKPAYAKAYADGAMGVWTPELQQLSQAPAVLDAFKQATRTAGNKAAADGIALIRQPFALDQAGNLALRRNPDGSVIIPNVQFWDHVQRVLRDKGESLARSGEKSAAADVNNLRRQILEQVDAAVPSFGQARAGAARMFQAEDALEAGQKFLTSNMPAHEARKALGKMTAPDQELFREGFRTSLLEKVRGLSDGRDVVKNIFNSPRAREQVEIALGKEGAAKLESALHVEQTMNLLRNALGGNSTTARQLADMGLSGAAGAALAATQSGDWKTLVGAGVGGAALRRQADARTAKRVMEILMQDNPKAIENLIAAAAKQPVLRKAIVDIGDRIAPALAGKASAALEGQAGPRAIQGSVPSRAEDEQR